MKRSYVVLASRSALLGAAMLAACNDPPGPQGQLVIDIDRRALRPDVSEVTVTVRGLRLFYDAAPSVAAHRDLDCSLGKHIDADNPETLSLTSTGRTYVGSANVPPGQLMEVWLLLEEPRILGRQLNQQLHTTIRCKDEDLGVVRLTTKNPVGVAIVNAQVTEIAAQLRAITDIKHVREDDKHAAIGGHGKGERYRHGDEGHSGAGGDPSHGEGHGGDCSGHGDGGHDTGHGHGEGAQGQGHGDGHGQGGNGHGAGTATGSGHEQGGDDSGHGQGGHGANPGHGEGEGGHASGPGYGDHDKGRWTLAGSLPFSLVPPGNGTTIVDGQLIVRFKDSAGDREIQDAIAAKSLSVLRQTPATHYFTLQLPNGAVGSDLFNYYKALDIVQFVAPNTVVQYAAFDPSFPQQVQWPQVGLNELPGGTGTTGTTSGPDPASGWGTTIGTFQPVVAVIDDGVDLTNPSIFPNLFINVKEIPQAVLAAVGDLNGDGVVDWHDLDADNDGFLTFADLDATNAKLGNHAACPVDNHEPLDQCDPLDLVQGNGHSLQACNSTAQPQAGYGWEDGIDADCNGFVDDIVGWNFDTDDNLVTPNVLDKTTNASHATTVAGIVGAVGGDGIDTVGINWKVRILPLKPLQSVELGTIDFAFRDSAYQAFHYAATMKADVINASFGCYVVQDGVDVPLFCSACGEYNMSQDKFSSLTKELGAELADVQTKAVSSVISISAGNCGLNHDDGGVFAWPASMVGSNVLTVASVGAATKPNVDQLSAFSDFGVESVSLAAPGEFFVELVIGGGTNTTCPPVTGIPFAGCSGTSYASPMVAGAAALVLAVDPSLTSNSCAIVDRVLRNADLNTGNLTGAVGVHGPRLNVKRAVENTVSTPVPSCP